MNFTDCHSLKVVDDDISIRDIKPKDDSDDDAYDFAPKEEKPMIAGIIDDRPNHLKRKELVATGVWKTLDPVDGPSGDQSIHDDDDETSGQPTHSRGDTETKRRRHDSSDDDLSPPRVANSPSSVIDTHRSRRKDSSNDDLSPPRVSRLDSKRSSDRKRHDSNDSDHTSRKLHEKQQRRKHDSPDDDLSPIRRKPVSGHDLSPVRESRRRDDDRRTSSHHHKSSYDSRRDEGKRHEDHHSRRRDDRRDQRYSSRDRNHRR